MSASPSEIAAAFALAEDNEGELTDWERTFLDSAKREWEEDQFLTDRQQEALFKIAKRF